MTNHIFAYKAPEEAHEQIEKHGQIVSEWDDEVLYELDDMPYSERSDLEVELREFTDGETVLRTREVEDTTRKSFSDLYPDFPDPELFERASPGGDIRKFTSNIYGGVDSTIAWRLRGSSDVSITSFDPMSITILEDLVDRGYCDEHERGGMYPAPQQILEWADNIEDRADVTCAVHAKTHFNPPEFNRMVGTAGFFVFGIEPESELEEHICEKAGVSAVPDEHPDPEWELKYGPTEYSIYRPGDFDDEAVTLEQPVLRMWWD